MPQFKLIEVIGVLVALAALIAVSFAAYKYVATTNFEAGEAKSDAKWEARETSELQVANAKIIELNDKARTLERTAQIAVTQANDARRKADEAAKLQVQVATDAVRAGLGRMCNDSGTAAGEGAGSGQVSPTAGDPLGPPGTVPGRLSDAVAEFLVGEANRADSYARKLIEAVAILKLDRETCNAP